MELSNHMAADPLTELLNSATEGIGFLKLGTVDQDLGVSLGALLQHSTAGSSLEFRTQEAALNARCQHRRVAEADFEQAVQPAFDVCEV